MWLTLGTSTRPDPRGWLVLLPKPQPSLSQDLSWTSGDVVEAAAGTAGLAVLGHCGAGELHYCPWLPTGAAPAAPFSKAAPSFACRAHT